MIFSHSNLVCKGQKITNTIFICYILLKKNHHYRKKNITIFISCLLSLFFPITIKITPSNSEKKIQNTLSLLKLSKSFFYYCLYFPALGTFFPTKKHTHTYPKYLKKPTSERDSHQPIVAQMLREV